MLLLITVASLGYAVFTHLSAVVPPDFREAMVAAERPLSLDPLVGADDPAVRDTGHLLYRSLLRLDATGYPRPDLASATAVSSDGLTIRVTLGGGHRWSDGRAITPVDVVSTVAFLQSPAAAAHGLAAQFQGVTLTLDHSTIVFTLPAPRASFLSTLTQLPILPLANTSAAHAATLASHAAAPMATSGPYVVSGSTASLISLAPNPYAQQQPVMKNVQLLLFSSFDDAAAAFASGRADAVLTVTPAQRARLLRTTGAHAYDIATFRFVDLLFNERVPQLADPLVRQALAAAITRKSLLADPLQQAGGLMQVDAVTEGLPWAATRDPQEQASPASANAMLDSAGWTVGPAGPRVKNGQALAFTLTVADADPLPLVANAIAQQMSTIGVTINVQVVPALTFVDKSLVPHTYELALADWDEGPDPDVTSFWHSSAVPPQGYNVSGGQPDLFLDRALDNLATTYDAQARIAAAKDVDRLLTADAPAVLLYTPEVSYVVRTPMRGAGPGRYGGSGARFDVMATWQPA